MAEIAPVPTISTLIQYDLLLNVATNAGSTTAWLITCILN